MRSSVAQAVGVAATVARGMITLTATAHLETIVVEPAVGEEVIAEEAADTEVVAAIGPRSIPTTTAKSH